MVLPKRCIEITSHAFHRAWTRFQLPKEKATATIRRALRSGAWYENPSQADEFLVLHRERGEVYHVIARIERRQVTVTTVYPMRNTAKVRAFRMHSDPVSAKEITQRYGLPG